MKFVKATCPSCGAHLELSASLTTATCPNCGNKILLDWEQPFNPAANLELGKNFLTAGNLEEVTRQFTSVLERNPESKEAWLWKGVCSKDSKETATHWSRTGFTREQIVQNLAAVVSGVRLLDNFAKCFVIEGSLGCTFGDTSVASIYLDSALQSRNAHPPRKDFLKSFESILSTLQFWMEGVEIYKQSLNENSVRHLCFGLKLLLNRLGADQKDDWIEGYQFYQDWSEIIVLVWRKDKRHVRGNLTYWRKYIEQTEARLPMEPKGR